MTLGHLRARQYRPGKYGLSTNPWGATLTTTMMMLMMMMMTKVVDLDDKADELKYK